MTTQQYQNMIDLIKANANGGDRVNIFNFYPEDPNGDDNGNQGWVARLYGNELTILVNGQCTGKRTSNYYIRPDQEVIFSGFQQEYMTIEQLQAYISGDTSAVRKMPQTPDTPQAIFGEYDPIWVCKHSDFGNKKTAIVKRYKDVKPASIDTVPNRPIIYGTKGEGFNHD